MLSRMKAKRSLERLDDSWHIQKSTIVFDRIKGTSLFESTYVEVVKSSSYFCLDHTIIQNYTV